MHNENFIPSIFNTINSVNNANAMLYAELCQVKAELMDARQRLQNASINYDMIVSELMQCKREKKELQERFMQDAELDELYNTIEYKIEQLKPSVNDILLVTDSIQKCPTRGFIQQYGNYIKRRYFNPERIMLTNSIIEISKLAHEYKEGNKFSGIFSGIAVKMDMILDEFTSLIHQYDKHDFDSAHKTIQNISNTLNSIHFTFDQS